MNCNNFCKYPVVYRDGEARVVTNKRKLKKKGTDDLFTCWETVGTLSAARRMVHVWNGSEAFAEKMKNTNKARIDAN